MTKRHKALPYQRAGVRGIEKFAGRALLADDMGLGKTIQALWWFARSMDQPKARSGMLYHTSPCVVVCPASVKYNWEVEAAEQLGIRADVLDGTSPPPVSRARMLKPGRLHVINYDILRHWVPYLRAAGVASVILDESQYIQNPEAKRTQAVQELCKGVNNVVALSGTPLTNKPAELWPTLNILRPDLYESFFMYAQKHCQPRRRFGRWQYNGAVALDELHADLKEHLMIRRLKADVLHDLPDKVRRVVPVPLSDMGEYQHANEDFLGWLRASLGPDKAVRASRSEKLVRVGYLLRLAGKLKSKGVVEWVHRYLEESGDKLVLFGYHRKMLDVLDRRIKAHKVRIDGTTAPRARQDAVEGFQYDDKIRVLVGQLQAAGVGITCTAAPATAHSELWWRPADFTQADDRIHRIGQKRTCWAYYLVARGTIEENLCSILQNKQDVISRTLDGTEGKDMDILDQLLHLEAEKL